MQAIRHSSRLDVWNGFACLENLGSLTILFEYPSRQLGLDSGLLVLFASA